MQVRTALTGSLMLVTVMAGCRTPASSRTQSLLGQPAPDFKLVSLEGQEVVLSGLKGKPVVVAFFGYG